MAGCLTSKVRRRQKTVGRAHLPQAVVATVLGGAVGGGRLTEANPISDNGDNDA